MRKAVIDASVAHELKRLVEALQLHAEVPVALLVCRCEMREDAGELEAAMEIDGLQKIDHVQIEYADAIHAGIDGEVVLGNHAIEVGLLTQSQRELLRDDRGRKIVCQHIGNGAHGRLRKHQDGSLDAMLA